MDDDDSTQEIAQKWYDHKCRLLEKSLGKAHDTVMHSIIAYPVGGLDLYYYPNAVPGTAIATLELSEMPNEGSSNDDFRSYELVMFTKYELDLDAVRDSDSPFGKAHRNISRILNPIARYSSEATLNPRETCEFPAEMEKVGGKCLIFDGYARHSDDVADNFGLLAIIEVFRREMNFARKRGGVKLIDRLKERGHYPYSDLDRDPVV